MTILEPHRPRQLVLPTPNPLAFIIKTAICVGLILVFWISRSAPAGAEPNPNDADSNLFGGLSCSCSSPTAPRGGPALTQEINRGIQQGLSGQEPST
jgi:hypothetical protein